MKILIIGYGSIGQRHYRNLSNLGFKDVWVYDIDRTKLAAEGLKTIARLSVEELKQFKAVFICNPNNLHIQTAMMAVKAGCHLFIEKPLANSLEGINELIELCQQKELISLVGCNMRFHPCLQFIKKYLDSGKLGQVYNISHEFGYYLPYWRENQDYRQNYAVKKETGGGIILDDIHEFDLLFWLNDFEEVTESKIIFDQVSDLELETEDICLASFKFKNKVLGYVSCDYLQQDYCRRCKIVGKNGNLEWDFNENIVWLKTKGKKEKLFESPNYDLNNMYIEELKYFFQCLENKQKTFNDIIISCQVLKNALIKNNFL